MGLPVCFLADLVAVVDVLTFAAALESVGFGAWGVAVGAWLGRQYRHDVEPALFG